MCSEIKEEIESDTELDKTSAEHTSTGNKDKGPQYQIEQREKFNLKECMIKFYANLGSNLANQISPGITKINDYLKQIPRSLNSFVMTLTTKGEVENLIKSLPNKQSCGHDKISNTMLKKLSEALSFPLTGIFNQSIIQGVFLNLMKIAEVIPLYKGKE